MRAARAWRTRTTSLDAGPQAEGTTVNVSSAGAHTVEFWSVDASANVESPRKSASFEVTIPATPPTPVYRLLQQEQRQPLLHDVNGRAGHRAVHAVVDLLARWRGLHGQHPQPRQQRASVPLLQQEERQPLLHGVRDREGHPHRHDVRHLSATTVPPTTSATTKVPGATTVYRFYNKSNGSHFYTASETEKANVLANLSSTYSLDGVAVLPRPVVRVDGFAEEHGRPHGAPVLRFLAWVRALALRTDERTLRRVSRVAHVRCRCWNRQTAGRSTADHQWSPPRRTLGGAA